MDAYLSHILVELPGCSDPLARQALMRSAATFCERTLAWDEVQSPVRLRKGTRDYELEAPIGAYVCGVRDVWVGQDRLQPATVEQMHLTLPGWNSQRGVPTLYNSAIERGQLSVFPIPWDGDLPPMVVRAAYAPLHTAREMPSALSDRHFDAICAGAKARLMAMPGQHWSQPQLAIYYQQQFDHGMAEGASEALHGRVQGTVFAAPRPFA